MCLVPAAVIAPAAGSSRTVDGSRASSFEGGLIVDHNCIDLSQIPSEWVEAAEDNIRVHYAHTSHGGQITVGLERIMSANSSYGLSIGDRELPSDEDALCIYDGNGLVENYITPDLYWETSGGLDITQGTLDSNPTISVSLWSWCTQLDSYSQEQVQTYLDAMTDLEDANPDVTFIYMTGNAQAGGDDGYNRWVNNQLIRNYCITNEKVLFDFADLDCWSNGAHSTYEHVVGSTTYYVPIEHEDFNGDEAAHTTYASCEQKGRAFWWLMATLAGWDSPTTTNTGSETATTSATPQDYTVLVFAGAVVGVLVIAGLLLKRR